ncbi:MAG: phospholipid carrier-dependent glycosyltransferase [Chloroflexi bacterium]|nr:phospholipid carrier-dependent glycosyltransferase [Chloroflexota bacterium]
MKTRFDFTRLAFPVLLGAFIALASAYSIVTPLGEGPDEVSHFAYVQYVIAHHRLPMPEGAVLGESHQPPLYYIISALAVFWIPQDEFAPIANPDFAYDKPQTPNLLLHTRREAFPYRDAPLAWHWLRLLSVVMGAVTVWATWHIASVFVLNDPWIVWGATAFVAFLPAFTFLSALVNNDNLIIMLSSVSVLQIFRIAQKPPRLRDAALLGVLLGLATLAKLSGLVVWLFVGVVMALLAWQSRQWKTWMIQVTICFGVAAVIVAPWIIYNLANYGDPLGWALVLLTTPQRLTPMTSDELVKIIGWGLYTSFWGRFGGALHLRMSDAIYAILGIVPLLALLGWMRHARAARSANHATHTRALVAAFGVFWAVMLTAFARWTLTVLGTDQARQLFPGLALFVIVLTLGVGYLFGTRKKIALAAIYGGLFALNLAVLLYLNVTFAGAPQNPTALPKLGGTAAPADFGNAIRVLDYRVEPARVAPGDSIITQIQWQALSDGTENYWLLLRLGAEDPVAEKEGVPAAGHPTTDWWQRDQVFTSHHTLVVPKDTAPGTYTLWLGLHPFERWEWLPVRGNEMMGLGNIKIEIP